MNKRNFVEQMEGRTLLAGATEVVDLVNHTIELSFDSICDEVKGTDAEAIKTAKAACVVKAKDLSKVPYAFTAEGTGSGRHFEFDLKFNDKQIEFINQFAHADCVKVKADKIKDAIALAQDAKKDEMKAAAKDLGCGEVNKVPAFKASVIEHAKKTVVAAEDAATAKKAKGEQKTDSGSGKTVKYKLDT